MGRGSSRRKGDFAPFCANKLGFIAYAMLMDSIAAMRRGFASAEATKGLSDRPLETFGAHPCFWVFIVAEKMRF